MSKALTQAHKTSLHKIYLAFRGLASSNMMKDRAVFESFEQIIAGFREKDTWRPMFVSRLAIQQMLTDGTVKNVRRAHGVLPGTLSRNERTSLILKGDELSFDEWWELYVDNDWTVLLTKDEHNENKSFKLPDLIQIVHTTPLGKLFGDAGFGPSFTKSKELRWLQSLPY